MIDDARLESDEGGWVLVLEDSMGTHSFPCDPQLIEDCLRPWKYHQIEGAIVQAERVAAGRVSWREYTCPDPEGEWMEMVREQGDMLRKRDREGACVDPGDETRAA